MPFTAHTAWLLPFLLCSSTSGSSQAASRTTTPIPDLEILWSEADGHSTTGVTIHIEFLTGLEDEGEENLGRTAALAAWLLRAPLPGAKGASLQELATEAGVEVLSEVDWRHVSATMWAPEALADYALWMAAARVAKSPPPVEASVLQAGLDALSTQWQEDAVGPLGDGFETIRRHMLGLRRGSTRLSSYLHADRLEDDGLVEMATHTAATVGARVIVVAPRETLTRLRRDSEELFVMSAERPLPRAHVMQTHPRELGAPEGRLVQQFDGRNRTVMAWRLPPVSSAGQPWRAMDTAALLSLSYWARHLGGGPARELVTGHGIAQKIESRAWLYPAPAFAIEATSRGSDMSDLKRRLAASIERLASQPMTTHEARAAARLAKNWLSMRWAYGPDRARLIGELASVGEAEPERWRAAVGDALDHLTPSQISSFVRSGISRESRQVLYVVPRDKTDVDRVRLDGDQIASYLKLVVDLRCPPPGAPQNIATLLRTKYDMAPRRYVALTRALASSPALMRDLSEEAESRCTELRKLRKLLSPQKVTALHEAILCGPGHLPTSKRGKKKLKRVLRRFDVDPSWYRPLLEATREDPSQRLAIEEIDDRCGPRTVETL
jgi:hypothetical protein